MMTIAEEVSKAENPHLRAIALNSRREEDKTRYPHTRTFYFSDGSHLVFEVAYTPVCFGWEK